jgi:hypothetical protein
VQPIKNRTKLGATRTLSKRMSLKTCMRPTLWRPTRKRPTTSTHRQRINPWTILLAPWLLSNSYRNQLPLAEVDNEQASQHHEYNKLIIWRRGSRTHSEHLKAGLYHVIINSAGGRFLLEPPRPFFRIAKFVEECLTHVVSPLTLRDLRASAGSSGAPSSLYHPSREQRPNLLSGCLCLLRHLLSNFPTFFHAPAAPCRCHCR